MNKSTRLRRAAEAAAKQAAVELAAEEAATLTPLSYLLAIVRNPKLPTSLRADAARSCLPYCHVRAEDLSKFDRQQINGQQIERPFDRQATIDALNAAFAEIVDPPALPEPIEDQN